MALTDHREPPRFEHTSNASQGANVVERSQAETQIELPGHPAYLMPSPGRLRHEYRAALEQIELRRGRNQRSDKHAIAMEEAAFDAFLSSLSASCHAIVCEAHPSGKWNRIAPAAPSAAHERRRCRTWTWQDDPRKGIHGGRGARNEEISWPLGCVLLVHFVETAQQAFEELSAALPGGVAVWTREHDVDRPINGGRTHLFSVDDLQRHPIIIVTHEFYKGVRGDKARSFTRNGVTLAKGHHVHRREGE